MCMRVELDYLLVCPSMAESVRAGLSLESVVRCFHVFNFLFTIFTTRDLPRTTNSIGVSDEELEVRRLSCNVKFSRNLFETALSMRSGVYGVIIIHRY